MHKLTRSQLKRAEKLAEDHTAASINPLFAEATKDELEVLGWALYLIQTRQKPNPGYTGRNSNKK